MRRRVIAAAIVVAWLPGGAAAQDTPPDNPAVSVERILRGLEKPVSIFADRRPDFSVSITDSLVFDNPFGDVEQRRRRSDWETFFTTGNGARIAGAIGLAAATASLAGNGTMSAKPLIAMNLVAVGTAVAGKVGTALHNRKVRKTSEHVRRELEEFCALNGCAVD